MSILSRSWAARWVDAGLAGELPVIVADWADAAERVRDERQQYIEKVQRHRESRVAVLAHATGKVATAPDSRADDFAQAHRLLEVEAVKALKAVGDQLITDSLAPAHADLLDAARPLADAIGDLETDDRALSSTTTRSAREAWVELGELSERRDVLLELLRELLNAGMVPLVLREHVTGWSWRTFARPDRQPPPPWAAFGGTARRHYYAQPAPLALAILVRDSHDCQPGIYTATEIAEHRSAAERDAFEAAQGGRS